MSVCGTPGCLRTSFHEPPDECAFYPPKNQKLTSSIQVKENARLVRVIDKLIDERNQLREELEDHLRLLRLIGVFADAIKALTREKSDAQDMLARAVASTAGSVIVIPPIIQHLDWELERLDTPNGFIRLEAKRVDK